MSITNRIARGVFGGKPAIHRVAAGTEGARKFQAAHQKRREPLPVDPGVAFWNKQVDDAKRAKLKAKLDRQVAEREEAKAQTTLDDFESF